MFMGSYFICFWSAGHQAACGYNRLVYGLLVAHAVVQCSSRNISGNKWVNIAIQHIAFIVLCTKNSVLLIESCVCLHINLLLSSEVESIITL